VTNLGLGRHEAGIRALGAAECSLGHQRDCSGGLHSENRRRRR
jgi:hypothetical protein